MTAQDLRDASRLTLTLFGPLALIAQWRGHEDLVVVFGAIACAAIAAGLWARAVMGRRA